MDRKKKIRLLSFSIKIIILLLTFGYIYKQIFYRSGIDEIRQNYSNFIEGDFNLLFLFSVIALMLVNWGLEAFKWKLMVAKIETISFLKSFKATVSGVTVSLFTPNRIGEFGGRVFFLNPEHRMDAVFITILCSMSQLLVTIITGILSLAYFLPKLIAINDYLYYAIVIIALALLVILLFIYFNIYLLNYILLKIPWLRRGEKYIHIFMTFSFSELNKVLMISFVRYCVFTLQYFLLLKFFNVDVPLIEGIILISLSFFIISVIPTVTLSELGIRGSVSIYFLGLLSANAVGILTSSFTLWIINLVIPALIGAIFILSLKLFRQG